MALTRKFLSALGIESDKIDEIISAHAETVDALKEDRDNYKKDAEKYADTQKKLDAANDELKELKKDGGADKWKVKYDALKEDFDDYKNSIESEKKKQSKSDALKKLLQEIGVSEKRIGSVMKVSDLDAIEFDDSGNIKDADTLKNSLKEEWADFIVKETKKGADTQTPPGSSGGKKMTREEIYKKDDKGRYLLDAGERQKALAESLAAESE